MRRLLPLAAVLASGCFATQKDILDLSQQNDTMQLQMQSLKKVMTQIQSNQADLNARLEDLHKDMSVLNESLKDSRDSTSRLSAKMDDLGAAIGVKVSAVQKGITETQEALRAAEERRKAEAAEDEARRKAAQEAEAARAKAAAEAEAAAKAAKAAAEAEAAAKAAKAAAKPSDILADAREHLDKKRYAEAAQGYELYLERFPKGADADQAGYGLGQARFAQERWEDAARAYAVVLDRFPKSPVTAASRLRYAQCLIKLKHPGDEAKRYLESIPHDFPKAPEAVKARELLQSLNGKKG